MHRIIKRHLELLQYDFIQRIKYNDLLYCDEEGQHSELTVLSGERLKQLRDFCWEMAEKLGYGTCKTDKKGIVTFTPNPSFENC